jgi:SAM-dependent methyltransferase
MPSCRICNAGPSTQKVRAETVFGGKVEHNFHECSSCEAVYLYPIPSTEEEALFYKQEFEKFMSSRAGSERDWANTERHVQTNQDQVKRRWPFLQNSIKPDIDLLEMGCSSGFMMIAFRDAGVRCIGIEPSGEFIGFLKEKDFEAYQSLPELLEKKPNSSFDLITHFFLFEHIRDPFSFLKETYQLLKPGGKMIMEIPCVHDPLTSVFNIPAFENFYWSIAHHYYYSKKTLEYILNKLGYQYEILPEQRYDLSNHITWMTEGKPGGQGKLNHLFSQKTLQSYRHDLLNSWTCDTVFLTVKKEDV